MKFMFSHANLEQPFRNLAINWEVNIFVKKPSCVFPLASLSLCRCELFYIYMCMYVDVNLYMWLYNKSSLVFTQLNDLKHHHHHHHVVQLARISLTLSRRFSLSFIASDRPSGLHPVSSHSCWMYVRAGHMWGSIGVHHLWACHCFSSSVLHVWFV